MRYATGSFVSSRLSFSVLGKAGVGAGTLVDRGSQRARHLQNAKSRARVYTVLQCCIVIVPPCDTAVGRWATKHRVICP